MVAPTRTALRDLFAALLAAGLMVLAAAMVTPGGDTVRGAGPAIHPAAEITPNALPRDDDAHLADDDGDGARPAPDDDTPQATTGDHGGTDAAAVAAEFVTLAPDDPGSDRVPDGHARPAASTLVSPVDGRAPPEPGAV
jgi:hypothetical protein